MNTTTPPIAGGSKTSGFPIWEYLTSPTGQAILGVLILLTIAGVAYIVLSKLRGSNNEDRPMTELLQKNFEEMRSEGDISEAEFRKIRASLGSITSKSYRPRNDANTIDPT